MKSVVFEFDLPGVLTLRVTGSNENRYGRYCKRIGKAEDDDASLVDYTASASGTWTIGGKTFSTDEKGKGRARPAFYESVYQVRCTFRHEAHVTAASVFHEMKSVADEFYFEGDLLDGRFDFVNVPGRFTFEIDYISNNHPQTLKLTWWVVSEKIDVVNDAKTIKTAIEKETPGFVHAFLSQTKGAAGLSRRSSENGGEWLEIYRAFVDPYVRAVKYIVHAPHLRYQPEVEYVRADRVRRWTPAMANRFSAMDKDRKERGLFRVERIQPKIDTPENRFVLFTLKKIGARLGELAQTCRGLKDVAESYVERVGAWQKELGRLRNHPFFRAIGAFGGLKQESLVLQRQRGYSKIYETWVALQHALDVTKSGLDAGNRPIWKLYEFWCYLTIRDLLLDQLDLVLDESMSGLGSLVNLHDMFDDVDPESAAKDADRPGKGRSKCQYVFNDADNNRTITLTYQQSYSNRESADVDDANMAHIVEQIPDIVLTIAENGGEKNKYTYLFDAKYQIMSLPSAEDPKVDAAPYETINEMHRYRDAILYRRQKAQGAAKGGLTHEIIGAYVLYPGRPGKCADGENRSFDYSAFISEENIGAIPLLPTKYMRNADGSVRISADGKKVVDGADGEAALRKFIADILSRKSKSQHLGVNKDGYPQVITTRGTEVSLEPVVDESAIVDVYWDVEKAEKIAAIAYKERIYPVEASLFHGRNPGDVKRLRIVSPAGAQFVVDIDCGKTRMDPEKGSGLDRQKWGDCFSDDNRQYFVMSVKDMVPPPPGASDTM